MARKTKVLSALAVSALATVGLGVETAAAADCSLGQQRIQGRGASFANQANNNAVNGWIINAGCVLDGGGLISFAPADKDPQELGTDPANTGFNSGNDLVFYDSQGSGNGLAAFGGGTGSAPKFSNTPGQRDPLVSYIGTDDPPQQGVGFIARTMEEGANVVAGAENEINDDDDGVYHTIPVAQSSLTVIIKRPLGCKLPASDVYTKSPRFKLPQGVAGATNSALEKIFAGEDLSPGGSTPPYTIWGDLGWKQNVTNDPCPVPVKRFVRRDNSGTTFGYKTFLKSTDQGSTTPWDDHDTSAEDNRIWPGRTVTDAFIDNDGTCDGNDPDWVGTKAHGDFVCAHPTSNGNSGLADSLNAAANGPEGGIGYADLATARSKGFDWQNTSDRTVWLPLYSPTNTTKVYEPQEKGPGFKVTHQGQPVASTPSLKGANCLLSQYGNNGTGPLPTNTKADWSEVVANPTVDAYPACILTFIGAWEDYNDAYPNTVVSCSEKQARQSAVRNYLEYVLGTTPGGDDGQNILAANDYSALSTGVLLKAQTYFGQASFKKSPNVNVC